MKRNIINMLCASLVAIMIASCGTKKSVVQPKTTDVPATSTKKSTTTGGSSATTTAPKPAVSNAEAARAFVKKVNDTEVYAKNIVASMTFNIQMGDKDISVPGSIHMRKNEVIRLQLFVPLLGSEVGRMEFTPNEVLVVDRMHKEYIRAGYDDLDFLSRNGLNFYTLQALFWNELLVPGAKDVTLSDYDKFAVGQPNGTVLPLTLTNNSMTYTWNANRESGLIESVSVKYVSQKHGNSSLLWRYSDFKTVGTKMFPATHNIKFATTASKKAKNMSVAMEMEKIKNDEKWDAKTTVSSKYKQVEPKDVLGKLLNR